MSTSHTSLDALSGAMLGVATMVVALRIYARSVQKAALGADDWLMLPAYICFVGLIASIFYGTHHRTLGYSTPEVKNNPVPQQVAVAVNRAVDVFASAYFGCVKASALFFFRRVFCIPGRINATMIGIWTLLSLTLIWTLLYILLPIFQCHTYFAAAWSTPAVRAKWCTLSTPYIVSQSVTDVAFDLAVFVLPLPSIWSLHTTVYRRVLIVLIFSTALVALAASIAKLVIVTKLFNHTLGGDILLRSTQIYFMWVLEAGFAIIAINLPTLLWLRSAKAPEHILVSVRSFFSIKSHTRKSNEVGSNMYIESDPDPEQAPAITPYGQGKDSVGSMQEKRNAVNQEVITTKEEKTEQQGAKGTIEKV